MRFYDDDVWLSAEEAVARVRNIYCVGRNYRDHATELGNAVPTEPMLFGKWTHAMVPCGGELRLPKGRTNIHHELELVLWLQRPYEPGTEWTEYVGGIALGLDLTDRDAQSRLKAAGQPWEDAKSFRGSGVVTDFYPVVDWAALLDTPFALEKNGAVVQEGRAAEMVFPFAQLLHHVGSRYGFGPGDLLFTGTPAGVGPLFPGDALRLLVDGDLWGTCTVSQEA
ncbi:MAG: fumarylacetoacetate hydrolase family protein [Alicyclobacillus sp.]|nr:fumarylacetoacetate hydrolase family protein [Alicyclobacillus sp.]